MCYPAQVMAFNLGSLGFLTNATFDEFQQDLLSVIYGYQRLDSCSMDFASLDSGDEGGNSLGAQRKGWSFMKEC